MIDPSDDRSSRVEAYLDDLLAPDERAAFERAVQADPALRAELELQRRIDGALRRTFTPCERGLAAIAPGAALASDRAARRVARPLHRHWPGALAAAVLIALGAAWFAWRPGSGSPGVGAEPRMLVEMYERQEQGGWRPDWVCDTDEDFAQYSSEILGKVVLVAPGPADVAVTGWKYDRRIFGQRTAQLLARVGDANALVLVGHVVADRTLSVPPDSGLRLFRRELDGLVLYEVTPKSGPAVLDLFYIPEGS